VTTRQEKFQEHAVKAGVRAAKRRHHMLSEEELRALKVQVMPALPRILMVVVGVAAMIGAYYGWPWDEVGKQFLEGLFGVGSTTFGIFGVRRTIGGIVDAAAHGAVDLVGAILEGIADAIGS
jgi:hypothetical protein